MMVLFIPYPLMDLELGSSYMDITSTVLCKTLKPQVRKNPNDYLLVCGSVTTNFVRGCEASKMWIFRLIC